jgi:hypothetical protein
LELELVELAEQEERLAAQEAVQAEQEPEELEQRHYPEQ